MSNVLNETKLQQVVALGRLGWSLRRFETATGVRRETISGYLKTAGLAVRRRGGRPTEWAPANPATTAEVSTEAVRRGRNAMAIWQDLVDQHERLVDRFNGNAHGRIFREVHPQAVGNLLR